MMQNAIRIFQSLFGRLVLFLHSALVIVYTYVIMKDQKYLLCALGVIPQLAEVMYVVLKRRCKEYTWVSMSTVCYLIAVVPPIWMVEVQMLGDVHNEGKKENNTAKSALKDLDTLFIEPITDELGMAILKQTMLLAIMFHRWFIPRGALSRNSLSHLLFVFFALASDITELFELFEEPTVLLHDFIGYVILGVWTLSLVQLCMSLTNTRLARQQRPSKPTAKSQYEEDSEELSNMCCHSVLMTDVWSIIITMTTMDIPFFAVRLYILIYLEVRSYGIFFFTFKNGLVILLSIYRFIVIGCTQHEELSRRLSRTFSSKSNGEKTRSARPKSTYSDTPDSPEKFPAEDHKCNKSENNFKDHISLAELGLSQETDLDLLYAAPNTPSSHSIDDVSATSDATALPNKTRTFAFESYS